MKRNTAWISACALLLSGCAIGPNYVRPTIDTPSAYRGQPPPATEKSLADVPRTTPAAATEVFAAQEQAAQKRVDRIIAAHLGAQAGTGRR